MATIYHEPVLAFEVVRLLLTKLDGVYVDATVGGGGHAELILKQLNPAGRLLGFDRDSDAIQATNMRMGPRIELREAMFSQIEASLAGLNIDGILFDFGVSSHQIDTGYRGFSHRFEGPLDLRMNSREGRPLSQTLGELSEEAIGEILRDYGEENQWRRLARAIRQRLDAGPIETTSELAEVISTSVAATRIKSLARVFQAFRIFVNDELNEIRAGLSAGYDALKPGGRLVALTYHSLEDRIAKEFMRNLSNPPRDPRDPFGRTKPLALDLTRKPIVAGADEVARNPRSRSAKLRAIEKLPA